MSDLAIRTMARDEIEIALDWAAAEGWNPGLWDGTPFSAADPEGFLIGCLGAEPVAVISAVRYGGSFGFIGLYIVKPGYRGQGHGRRLWQAAMERLAGRSIGLDGVVAQQDNYRRSGFALAHRNVRYQGSGGGRADAVALPADVRMTPLASVPTAELERYDAAFFPVGRGTFLQNWIAQPGTTALGLVRDGRLEGYGVLRPCRKGYKLGPLFADTLAGAESLFLTLRAAAAEDAPVFLDVPECNAEAVALARRHGMEVMFETARMYAGPVPNLSLARTFGITSFELG